MSMVHFFGYFLLEEEISVGLEIEARFNQQQQTFHRNKNTISPAALWKYNSRSTRLAMTHSVSDGTKTFYQTQPAEADK